MKNILTIFCLCICVSVCYGQLKVVANGDVKIGTTSVAPTQKLDVDGNMVTRGNLAKIGFMNNSGGAINMSVGEGRTADGNARFELIGDAAAYPAYGFQFTRFNTGLTTMKHRGTNDLQFTLQDGGFWVMRGAGNTQIMKVDANAGANQGWVKIGAGNASHFFHVNSADAAKPGGGSWVGASDKALKRDINKYEGGLDEILQIKPVTFKYNGKGGIETGDKEFVGVIAQDYQEIVPQQVGKFTYSPVEEILDNEGNHVEYKNLEEETYLSVDDSSIKYMLINAVKEQQSQIEARDQRIEKLEEQLQTVLTAIENLDLTGEIVNSKVTLTNIDKAFLGQNVPNPFNGETTIEYSVPTNAGNAKINFYNLNGKLIKSKHLNHTGQGSINVNAIDMPSGTYTYNLVIDGNSNEAYKMVVSK